MTQKGIFIALTSAAVLLPVAITLTVATGFIFAALQDIAGARALFAVALGCGLLWAMDLVGLVLLLGFDAATRRDGHVEYPEDDIEHLEE